MHTTRSYARRVWAFGPVCVLALVLLMAQTLGVLHKVVHSPLGHPDSSVVAKLFSSHQDDSDCRVFDQLSHGDSLVHPPAVALPLLACFFLLPFFQGEALRRWAALFEARGPPVSR